MAARPIGWGELVLVEHALPVVELALPARSGRDVLHVLEEPQRLRVRARDRAEDRPLLLADPGQVLRIGGQKQRLRARLAARHLLHHEERPLEPARVLLEPERLGDGHLAPGERPVGLVLDGPLGLDQAAGGVATQDQAPLSCLSRRIGDDAHPIGLARGAAVDALDLVHPDSPGVGHPVLEVASEVAGERCEGVHEAESRTARPARQRAGTPR
jgi:hypothetical protein